MFLYLSVYVCLYLQSLSADTECVICVIAHAQKCQVELLARWNTWLTTPALYVLALVRYPVIHVTSKVETIVSRQR